MNWVSIIAVVISGIGLVISIIALLQSKKANKAVMRQNLEQELARIETDIKDIEAQQEDARGRGRAETRNIYAADVPNPYAGVIIMLEQKKQYLQERKAEIKKQLRQL